MDDAQPRLMLADAEGGARGYTLAGRWTAAQLADRATWRTLSAQLQGARAADGRWDLQAVQQLDHIGAQLLWDHWQQGWPDAVEVSAGQRAMLERVARFTVPAPAAAKGGFAQGIDSLGLKVIHAVGHMRYGTRLVGQLLIDCLRLLRAPWQGPWRDISGHLYSMGAMALPITALVGFLIGVVLAYLMSMQLKQFGADAFIVNILGISLIRELGPLLAAILVAGRSGSAITAQIGVMRVTEELDAMRVMGIAQGFRLVMPRALALAVAMPLVAVWTTLASLAGGMLAADVSLGVTPAFFLNSLPQAVLPSNLAVAMFKSLVFGVLIALVGCHFGMRVKPNTESLGQGTTASVVTSITVVILIDALFAIVFRNVGI
ncbi:MlaE family ABC transporter permease [Xylophilus sp. ASV27]|uniref:MlaE family ABC transporter permease n=1 Tax=Xylophilus sp. ASV27 TaxID=2795129 RepID=UPI0018EC3920